MTSNNRSRLYIFNVSKIQQRFNCCISTKGEKTIQPNTTNTSSYGSSSHVDNHQMLDHLSNRTEAALSEIKAQNVEMKQELDRLKGQNVEMKQEWDHINNRTEAALSEIKAQNVEMKQEWDHINNRTEAALSEIKDQMIELKRVNSDLCLKVQNVVSEERFSGLRILMDEKVGGLNSRLELINPLIVKNITDFGWDLIKNTATLLAGGFGIVISIFGYRNNKQTRPYLPGYPGHGMSSGMPRYRVLEYHMTCWVQFQTHKFGLRYTLKPQCQKLCGNPEFNYDKASVPEGNEDGWRGVPGENQLLSEWNSEWRVQCVPKTLGSFENRLSLPEEWRGVRDAELSEKSGIPGCVFVHSSGFIGGNKSFQGVLEMARRSLDSEK
ncbi:hypothetical protein Btru_010006 [Bulinus truncatus]|nr:hypothetical protein Btru_010006 [Bulinus truncatus]